MTKIKPYVTGKETHGTIIVLAADIYILKVGKQVFMIYSLRCSKGSRLGHDCAYQGVINYHGVFHVWSY
jgi:hypothetical protein